MRTQLAVPILASILILGTLGLTDAFAGNHGNNGNNGCENANPNAKACESNPNTNHPPTIGSVTLTELGVDVSGGTASIHNPIECIANDVNDADGDDVTLSYEWIRQEDGALIATESTLPALSAGFILDHTMICKVTPFDGTDIGDSASQTVELFSLGGGL